MIATMARTPLFASLRRALRLAHQAAATGADPAALAAAPRRGPDRRTVLRTALGAAALAPLAAACGDNLAAPARVAVIGGGTAGLHCAVRLDRGRRSTSRSSRPPAGSAAGCSPQRGPANGKIIELGGELDRQRPP
jgi:monoamine oxidase